MHALSVRDVAAELGRSADWVLRNRDALERKGMPRPVIDTAPYTWNAIQFYAWLDRDLPPAVSERCAVIRAARTALASTAYTQNTTDTEEIASWEAKLNAKFCR